MEISTVYPVTHNGKKWVATIETVEHGRDKLTARIKALIRRGVPVEEEWAALAIVERRNTEDRWRKTADRNFYENLPVYLK